MIEKNKNVLNETNLIKTSSNEQSVTKNNTTDVQNQASENKQQDKKEKELKSISTIETKAVNINGKPGDPAKDVPSVPPLEVGASKKIVTGLGPGAANQITTIQSVLNQNVSMQEMEFDSIQYSEYNKSVNDLMKAKRFFGKNSKLMKKVKSSLNDLNDAFTAQLPRNATYFEKEFDKRCRAYEMLIFNCDTYLEKRTNHNKRWDAVKSIRDTMLKEFNTMVYDREKLKDIFVSKIRAKQADNLTWKDVLFHIRDEAVFQNDTAKDYEEKKLTKENSQRLIASRVANIFGMGDTYEEAHRIHSKNGDEDVIRIATKKVSGEGWMDSEALMVTNKEGYHMAPQVYKKMQTMKVVDFILGISQEVRAKNILYKTTKNAEGKIIVTDVKAINNMNFKDIDEEDLEFKIGFMDMQTIQAVAAISTECIKNILLDMNEPELEQKILERVNYVTEMLSTYKKVYTLNSMDEWRVLAKKQNANLDTELEEKKGKEVKVEKEKEEVKEEQSKEESVEKPKFEKEEHQKEYDKLQEINEKLKEIAEKFESPFIKTYQKEISTLVSEIGGNEIINTSERTIRRCTGYIYYTRTVIKRFGKAIGKDGRAVLNSLIDWIKNFKSSRLTREYGNEGLKGNMAEKDDVDRNEAMFSQSTFQYAKSSHNKQYEVYQVDAKDIPLFEGEIEKKDLRQGHAGDCYFVSAVATIIDNDPKYIKDMMYDDGNGNVVVRFYDNDSKPVYVTVRKTVFTKVPVDGDERVESVGMHYFSKGCWATILEKAYAMSKLCSSKIGYEGIDGGDAKKAFLHMTGINTHLKHIKTRAYFGSKTTNDLDFKELIYENGDDEKYKFDKLEDKEKVRRTLKKYVRDNINTQVERLFKGAEIVVDDGKVITGHFDAERNITIEDIKDIINNFRNWDGGRLFEEAMKGLMAMGINPTDEEIDEVLNKFVQVAIQNNKKASDETALDHRFDISRMNEVVEDLSEEYSPKAIKIYEDMKSEKESGSLICAAARTYHNNKNMENDYDNHGIIEQHEYFVKDVYRDKKTKRLMVTLSNPWGSKGMRYIEDTDENGEKYIRMRTGDEADFSLDLNQFVNYYGDYTITPKLNYEKGSG